MSASHHLRPDFLVVGAGIVGLAIARELKSRHRDCHVAVIDKEMAPGLHASGRNSGVLHAGFYYSADSLKARFAKAGNAAMHTFCEERGLKISRCGKLVVARDAGELAGLDELLRRARANRVELREVTEAEAREIEPRVRTCGRALYSPTTATVDPLEVVTALADEARRSGVLMNYGTAAIGPAPDGLMTSHGAIDCGYVVNSAGLYADRLAHAFGFGRECVILPFKGIYLYASEPIGALRTNVYPVPDLRNPFLGVHFTVTVDGRAKIGPTAIPCLWREQYGKLGGFSARDAAAITASLAGLMLRAGFDFRGLALQEMRKYHRPTLVAQAARLLDGVRAEDYTRWGRPGIRAQLLDRRARKLVMDFRIEGDERSLHVLNAVSPAFTCAFPFATHVCDEIERRVGQPHDAPTETRSLPGAPAC